MLNNLKVSVVCDVCDTQDAREYVTDPTMPDTLYASCERCKSNAAIPLYSLDNLHEHASTEPLQGKTVLLSGTFQPASDVFANICKVKKHSKN